MAIFAKLSYDEGVSVDALLVVRFGLAGLALLGLATANGSLRRLSRRSVGAGLAMGAVGYAAQAGLYLAAVARFEASQVALVFGVYPVLVTIAAILVGRERGSFRRAVALAMALGGVALVLGGATGAGAFDPVGALLSLGSAAVYTCYILVGDRIVSDVPPVPLAALVCSGAAASCLTASLVVGGPDLGISATGWGWLAAIALVSTVGAILLFFAGLARVGPTVASLLSTVEPVVTVGSAALVFHESMSPIQVVGGALVLAAVIVVQWPTPPNEVTPGRLAVDRGHGHEADTELSEDRQDLVLRVTGPQRVLGLQGSHGVDRVGAPNGRGAGF